jgi:predicted RNase H-like HicB family nuclease
MKENTVNVIIEQTPNNYCAGVEGLDGFVCTSDSLANIKMEVLKGIEFHLDGMKEDNDPIPSNFEKPYKVNFKIK